MFEITACFPGLAKSGDIPMGDPLRLLVVEDSEDDAALILHHLVRGGFDVSHERVDTPETMQAALDRWTPDVVLADYSLPSFNAAHALSVVKKAGLDVPFLIVSGSIGEDIAVSCMHAGANDYIMKDKLSRLVPAIRRELREYDGRQARRAAEQALRESEARYRLLIENTTDLITMSQPDGTLLYVSPSSERLLGYPPEALLGMSLADLAHDDDREAYAAVFRADAAGESFATTELRVRASDDSWHVMEVTTTLKGRAHGQAVRLATWRDVTERRHLEDQLRQSQKMEAVGQLAGGVAHDFNNLLTAILGYSELVLDQVPEGSEVRGEVTEIRNAAERAAKLTRQLLAFSRRQVLAPRVIELNDTVAAMGELIRRLIGAHIELTVVLEPLLGRVKADPTQVEQVILNLVVNARDAMAEGGRLVIETANVVLDETYARLHAGVSPGPYAMLGVRDTGHGMDAETMSHLFEPFFTTKGPGSGTGLGLSTVYGIVQQSGGHIWVDSEVGRGTTFKIYLPRVDGPVGDEYAPTPSAAVPKGTETLLVVEDESSVRTLICSVLRRAGYHVLEADGGGAALETFAAHSGRVHLTVTDVVMPEMGGPELAERLVALDPSMRVLFISGYTDHGIVHEGRLDPTAMFLQKPFTPEALLRKIQDVLAGSPLAKSARGAS